MTENTNSDGLLNTGDKVGRYEVQSVLGSGGESTVYKGYDAMLDRHVAIKQVAPQYAGDADFVANLQRNIRVLVKVAQRNDSIIDVHEMVQDERGLFVVMEYVEGPTLQQVLADSGVNGPLEPKAALVIIFRLAAGLNEMHSDGMIHRDIKPSNIVMAEGVKPRIIDYGVATVAGSDASMPLVTMKYLAPELHNLDGEVDGRSDIYSLGFMMYELLLGEEQFNRVFADVVSDTHQATMRWMKWHGNPGVTAPLLHELNPDIPVSLSTIVDKMISKDPDERYASAEELGLAIKGTFKKGRKGKAGPAMVAHPVGQTSPAARPAMSEEGLDTNMAPLAGGVAAAPGVFDAGPETAPLPKGPMSKNTKIALIAIAAVLVVGFCGLLIHRSQLRKERERAWATSAQGLYDAAREAYKAQEYATAVEKDADLIKKYPHASLSKRAQIYLPMSEAHLATQAGDWDKAHGLVNDARENAESLEAEARPESELATFAQDRLDDIEKLRSKVYSYRTCTVAIADARKSLNRPPDNLIQFDQIIRALDTTLGRGDVNLTEAQASTVQTVKAEVKRGKFLFELNELEQEGDKEVKRREFEKGIRAYDQAVGMFGGEDPAAKLVLAAARDEIRKRISEKSAKARKENDLKKALDGIAREQRNSANPDRLVQALVKLLGNKALMAEVSPRQRKNLEYKLKKAQCNHWLAIARKHIQDGNFIAAKPYLVKVQKLDRRNAEAKQMLIQGESKTKRAALVKAADAAYAKRDYAAARKLYVAAAGIQADAYTAGQIRECEYHVKLNEGHALLKAKKYDEAKAAYLQAKTIQPAHTAEVDALIAAIDTERAYRTKTEAGDAALKKKSFSTALSQYKAAQKIKDTPEVAKKIKLCQYNKHLTHGKEAVEGKNWKLAKWNFEQALRFNKTQELENLLAGVLKKIEEEED